MTASSISTSTSDHSTSSSNTDSLRRPHDHSRTTHSQQQGQYETQSRNSGLQVPTSNVSHTHVHNITEQARRFAETRFAFPPIIVKSAVLINERKTILDVVEYFKAEHDLKIDLAGHRLKNGSDLLIFAANRETFAALYDEEKWPVNLKTNGCQLIRPNHLPPQFSVIIRNVATSQDTHQLLLEIQGEYPDVVNAFRISNREKMPTSIVRLDIKEVKTLDVLLKTKFLYASGMRYPVAEFIAPAKVLLCSKCFAIGHFRSACPSLLEICRVCGVSTPNGADHSIECGKQPKCVRCQGSHEANDNRCPEIKSYRAALTRTLLARNPRNGQVKNSAMNPWNRAEEFPGLSGPAAPQQHCKNWHAIVDQRIEALDSRLKSLEENLNRIIDLSHQSYGQQTKVQHLLSKLTLEQKAHQVDISFQMELTN